MEFGEAQKKLFKGTSFKFFDFFGTDFRSNYLSQWKSENTNGLPVISSLTLPSLTTKTLLLVGLEPIIPKRPRGWPYPLGNRSAHDHGTSLKVMKLSSTSRNYHIYKVDTIQRIFPISINSANGFSSAKYGVPHTCHRSCGLMDKVSDF